MPDFPLTYFAPQLYIPHGIKDISFYKNAFDAAELRSFLNEDGSIHVAELSINGALFHLHEEKPGAGQFSALQVKGTTVFVGLFVPDVDAVVQQAVAAGAIVLSEPQSYDYGYRQAEIRDPFGHVWLIECKTG